MSIELAIALNLSSKLVGAGIEPFTLRRDDDELLTPSSQARRDVEDDCLDHIEYLTQTLQDATGDAPSGLLHRPQHQAFLRASLGRLPSGFTALDASRPWFLYWCINALASLGFDASQYRHGLVQTLRNIQNTSGGFGGGQGQYSHLATTYAAVLSIAVAGGDEALQLIDRRALWLWMGKLKQEDGSFRICEDGEIDIRAAYIVLVLATLLNLPLTLPPTAQKARSAGHEKFVDGLEDWIASCQTYEGGLGSIPGAEAHGAYTFCGLACLCIIDQPSSILPRTLDLGGLTRWLAHRQHSPTGGLAGRTNKLVDGCYSTWIGGCYALVEAALLASGHQGQVWEADGLLQYIYGCAQELNARGGLRDKPGMQSDAYHTNYNLLGLASAQYRYRYSGTAEEEHDTRVVGARWTAERRAAAEDAFDKAFRAPQDELVAMSPTYNIPMAAVTATQQFFADKPILPPAGENAGP